MPVEAELTAVVRDPGRVRAALAERAEPERSVYADTYYDRPDHSMDRDGYELRVRTITTDGQRQTVVTYKEPPVDAASRSKPEHETAVDAPAVMATIFTALGLVELISLEKHCENYGFTANGREMLATIVTIPELAGQTFIELETIAEQDDLAEALGALRVVLDGIGVTEGDAVEQSYTDMVAAARDS
ncbi:class IV adenylate cyclase [Amycolatopsis echigonensis]|uniref:Adenylate cyclase class 2 n=1 Tax=Amycolatopsis echigonensis TaxID=2576905 RepID=A0A2N3WA60_9PSEU|nr:MULTISPECIES: class IV adenylate cyclase [Amycolatopsis]MBB2505663.1 class IV adenylate cyclase [Amycolatopsis echigonensis]PKV90752.1 adenylate cyclase class 2 [Amycolatopsis niigatensis]